MVTTATGPSRSPRTRLIACCSRPLWTNRRTIETPGAETRANFCDSGDREGGGSLPHPRVGEWVGGLAREEFLDRLLRFVAEHRESEPVAGVADRLVPRDVAPPVQVLLRVASRLRELRRQLAGVLFHCGVELCCRDSAVDQAPLGRLRRRNLLAEHHD